MKNNKKGFTLAELLIVVAIIAVLVGVSIPVFTAQLEKSKEATDLANIRAAYAECTVSALTETTATAANTTPANGVYVTVSDTVVTCKKKVELKQGVNNWATADPNCAGQTLSNDLAVAGKAVEVSVTSTGTVTFTSVDK